MQQHLANSVPLNYGRRYSIKDLRIFLKRRIFSLFLNPISKNQRTLMWCHELDTLYFDLN
jgi:hypothetical protein